MLDLRTRKAKIGNLSIDLPSGEFILAETFFRHPGQVMSREVLLILSSQPHLLYTLAHKVRDLK